MPTSVWNQANLINQGGGRIWLQRIWQSIMTDLHGLRWPWPPGTFTNMLEVAAFVLNGRNGRYSVDDTMAEQPPQVAPFSWASRPREPVESGNAQKRLQL